MVEPWRGIRLVVLDVDGTLLTSDARLSLATQAAVGRALAGGLQVGLATSRGPGGLRWLLGQLGLAAWVVAYQGALVGRLDRAGGLVGAPLVDHPIPGEVAQGVLEDAAASGLSVSWFVGESWFALRDDPAMRREAGIVRDGFVLAGGLSGRDPHKLMLIAGRPEQVPVLHQLAGGCRPAASGTSPTTTTWRSPRPRSTRPRPSGPWPRPAGSRSGRWPPSATGRTTWGCCGPPGWPSPWATPSRP
jgi:hypothetical protein